MKITILTTFPEMFTPLHTSMLGRAEKAGILEIREVDIRAYSKNKHHNTDDAPFGGGAGMVMLAQPIVDAIRDVQGGRKVKRIYLSPRGETLTQKKAEQLAREDELILLCGHYEGVDQRALDLCIDEEISIGDYVLTGGELGAMVLVDCVARLVPGVLGCEESAQTESFSSGLLEYPQYTRPEVWEGRAVPPVLLGGDHQKIDAWRGEQSRTRTRLRRPELYEAWCRTHPITELPKWKRGENVRLVKTEEQFRAAAQLFAEGRKTVCADGWTAEYLETLTPEVFLEQLKQEKQDGWVCYLHYTKDVADGMVSVNHKTGQVEHLFVSAAARGKGIGMKMLDFARKKLPEHQHPTLTILDTNTRALALYRRMGWAIEGIELVFDPEKFEDVAVESRLLKMRYEG